jgi:hypothetical protein
VFTHPFAVNAFEKAEDAMCHAIQQLTDMGHADGKTFLCAGGYS